MILDFCYFDNPLLKSKSLAIEEITEEIKALSQDMIDTMLAKNGVGLAAPQVGRLLRMIVILPEIELPDGSYCFDTPEVYINPILSNPSKEEEIMEEGCLSLPKLIFEIKRPLSVQLEALDLQGNKIAKTLVGYKARQIQHEIDHLDGILIFDIAENKEINDSRC